MIWFRTLRLGVKSLLLHPMRSMLTMVGISIGVWAVICLLAIGEGISAQAQKQIEGLGADILALQRRGLLDDSTYTSSTSGCSSM